MTILVKNKEAGESTMLMRLSSRISRKAAGSRLKNFISWEIVALGMLSPEKQGRLLAAITAEFQIHYRPSSLPARLTALAARQAVPPLRGYLQ
jgi:hypothetical protein